MTDTRRRNVNWTVTNDANGSASFDGAQLAVLMDIRDELQALNRLLHCPNAIAIPDILRAIRKNTTKRKPRARR